MPAKPVVLVLAAGAALTVGASLPGCPSRAPELATNPPPPEQVPEPPVEPEPAPPTGERESAHLPTWDQLGSGHPEGATNPPIPFLVVTPEGDCYKQWVSPMVARPGGPGFGNRVEADCAEGCGAPIQCPPEADALLEAWRAQQAADDDG